MRGFFLFLGWGEGVEGRFEKRRLSLSSRQSNAAEQCSSSEAFLKIASVEFLLC